MAVSGITVGGAYATTQPPLPSLSQHKHGHQGSTSLSDIDAQGSSVASAPSPTGKIGNKLNMSA